MYLERDRRRRRRGWPFLWLGLVGDFVRVVTEVHWSSCVVYGYASRNVVRRGVVSTLRYGQLATTSLARCGKRGHQSPSQHQLRLFWATTICTKHKCLWRIITLIVHCSFDSHRTHGCRSLITAECLVCSLRRWNVKLELVLMHCRPRHKPAHTWARTSAPLGCSLH